MNDIKKNRDYLYKYPDIIYDKNYMYIDLSADPQILEGETGDEFAERWKNEIETRYGITYEDIVESEEYKFLNEGFDEFLEKGH